LIDAETGMRHLGYLATADLCMQMAKRARESPIAGAMTPRDRSRRRRAAQLDKPAAL
jgi:hypothetical protein